MENTMEITITRKMFNGGKRVETVKTISGKGARAAYRRLEKRVEEENEKVGEKRWVIDCVNTETGEIVWHN